MKVNTQTGLIQHREAKMRDACVSSVHLVVGMSSTVGKGDTISVNYVRCSFHCFGGKDVVRTRMTVHCILFRLCKTFSAVMLRTSIVPSLRYMRLVVVNAVADGQGPPSRKL